MVAVPRHSHAAPYTKRIFAMALMHAAKYFLTALPVLVTKLCAKVLLFFHLTPDYQPRGCSQSHGTTFLNGISFELGGRLKSPLWHLLNRARKLRCLELHPRSFEAVSSVHFLLMSWQGPSIYWYTSVWLYPGWL